MQVLMATFQVLAKRMKFSKKLKLLTLTITLAFSGMTAGQYLLFRETTDSIIFHCREMNRQQVTFHNLISSLSYIPSQLIQNKFNHPDYCDVYISPEYAKIIEEIKSSQSQKMNAVIQELGDLIRIRADNYQSLMRKRAENTELLIMSILIANVLSLAAMSMFLKFDSEEIG